MFRKNHVQRQNMTLNLPIFPIMFYTYQKSNDLTRCNPRRNRCRGHSMSTPGFVYEAKIRRQLSVYWDVDGDGGVWGTRPRSCLVDLGWVRSRVECKVEGLFLWLRVSTSPWRVVFSYSSTPSVRILGPETECRRAVKGSTGGVSGRNLFLCSDWIPRPLYLCSLLHYTTRRKEIRRKVTHLEEVCIILLPGSTKHFLNFTWRTLTCLIILRGWQK